MAPGRKRKPGKRYPCGKRTRHELEKDAMRVAIAARRRHFVNAGVKLGHWAA